MRLMCVVVCVGDCIVNYCDVSFIEYVLFSFFFSSRRRHTRCALVTGVQTCALPIYRLYPQVRFPDFVKDGANAVKWARDNADRYGGSSDRLFVMGHSSGAHIAAMLALDEEFLKGVGGSRSWLRGMIGLAGPYDFMPITEIGRAHV